MVAQKKNKIQSTPLPPDSGPFFSPLLSEGRTGVFPLQRKTVLLDISWVNKTFHRRFGGDARKSHALNNILCVVVGGWLRFSSMPRIQQGGGGKGSRVLIPFKNFEGNELDC